MGSSGFCMTFIVFYWFSFVVVVSIVLLLSTVSTVDEELSFVIHPRSHKY